MGESGRPDGPTLRELYHGVGLTLREIGRRYTATAATVLRWMVEAGMEGRLVEELVVEVAGLYGYRLTGVRWRDLAELVFLTQYVRGRHEEPTARAVRD